MELIGKYGSVLKEYFFTDVINNENFLQKIGTTETGVVTGDRISMIAGAGYTDGIGGTCGEHDWNKPTLFSEDTWSISDVELPYEFCYKTWEKELKRNMDLYNLSSDAASLKIIKKYIGDALANNALCLALFGDTASANAKLQLTDGIIKKVMAIVSGNASRKSAGVTQTDVYMRTNTNAIEAIENLFLDAAPELKSADNQFILMTQKYWDAIEYNMKFGLKSAIEPQWTALFGGMKETTWNSRRVVVCPAIDTIIASVANNALAGNPYFALYTTTDNIRFGSSSTKESGVADIDVWENKDLNVTRAKVDYSIGAIVAQSNMIQASY